MDLTAELKLRRSTKLISLTAQRRLYRLALLVGDALAIAAAFWLAFVVRFYAGLTIFQPVTGSPHFYQGIILLLVPAWLVIFGVFGLYDERNLLGGNREYALVFNACTTGAMIVILASFLRPEFIVARAWLIMSWLFAFGLASIVRFVMRRVIYALRRRGYFLAPALIVGNNEEARALADQLLGWQTSGLNILGIVANKAPPGMRLFRNLYALGPLDRLPDLVDRYGVEELILAGTALTRAQLLDLFHLYGTDRRVRLRLSSGLFEIMTTGMEIKEVGRVPLVSVNKVRLTGLDVAMKTVLDYGLTVPGLVAVSPLLLGLALWVKFDSPGPIIYRRRVLGVGGRQFNAFKFRTMHVNGDEILAQHPELQEELRRNHKLKDDPRVTRVGRLLRRTSLDELPQLFNVLLGQMSLVGPRMISPPELEKYGKWGTNLLTVKPGLTGLWQVSGRSDISYEERVRLDMEYIRNYSVWLDLQILFQTLPAILRGRGAY
jgi:exopolysaccharide biosynthesis polyprenyl glycosylphosphotransferase